MSTSLEQTTLSDLTPIAPVDMKSLPIIEAAPPSPSLSSHGSFDELPSRARTPFKLSKLSERKTPRSTHLLETFLDSHRSLHELQ
jgi:hypothetical protein